MSEPLTIAQFQSEVGVWSRRNFPNNTPDDPFEGLVEEVGELAHARLKARQGIRGDAASHLAAEKDAVGDATVYLADWCERKGLSLVDGVRMAFEPSFEGETFVDLDRALREGLASMPDRTPDLAFRFTVAVIGELAVDDRPANIDVGGLLSNLGGYCTLRGWSFAEVVEETWTKVRQRDWRANPAGPPDGSSPLGPAGEAQGR